METSILRGCVVRSDGARVGQLREPGVIVFRLGEQGLVGDRDRDHFAAFFGPANGITFTRGELDSASSRK